MTVPEPLEPEQPAVDARSEIRALMEAKGHAVDNARTALERLEAAFEAGEVPRTAALELMADDLRRALDREPDQKLGGKSAEAARFILRSLVRELDRTVVDGGDG